VLEQLRELRPGEERPGAYVELVGRPNEPIDADKFDKSGLTLLKVEQAPSEGEAGDLVFFAPRSALETVARKVEAFRDEDARSGRPKNADLVQSIGSLQRASLKSLWRGPRAAFPAERHALVDWEVWLKMDAADAFVAAARAARVPVSEDRLTFPEQTVVQVTASREALSPLVHQSVGVMALAKPSTTAEFFDALPIEEQDQWTSDLLSRTTFARIDHLTRWITLLDTGVSVGHPLIASALHSADRFAANPAWSVEDVHGHGTGMAGLALYGDLTTALQAATAQTVYHRLESVKIIPDAGGNPHHLLGAVTRRAIDAAEVRGERARVFTLASTTSDDHPHDGAPTSWSTEVDQLAAGTSGRRRERRLILASAGNVPSHKHLTTRYHDVCDAAEEELEAPGQAWNAIPSVPIPTRSR
jgi:Subtilase family